MASIEFTIYFNVLRASEQRTTSEFRITDKLSSPNGRRSVNLLLNNGPIGNHAHIAILLHDIRYACIRQNKHDKEEIVAS